MFLELGLKKGWVGHRGGACAAIPLVFCLRDQGHLAALSSLARQSAGELAAPGGWTPAPSWQDIRGPAHPASATAAILQS
jgi:hypothetical protein